MGYGLKKEMDKKTAAIYLLIDTWTFERDRMDIDHFHWPDNVGLLSEAEFMAIGRIVWPEEYT